jgi:peroxiredoxin
MLLISRIVWAQSDKFTIQGKLENAKAEKVFLFISDIITGISRADSVLVINGNFTFRGDAKMPLKAILFSVPDKNRLDFFIESGKLDIRSRDSLHNAEIKAGSLNADYLSLKKITDAIETDMRNYDRAMQAALTASPEKKQDQEFQRTWNLKQESAQEQLQKAYHDFAVQNPNNIASIYAIANFVRSNTDLAIVQAMFQDLSQRVRESALGKVYADKLNKLARVSIGATAPEFSQADTAGRPVSLKDFRGKYVLIDFWASWCGPCREENPNLIKAFERYKDNNFTVLGVSLDRRTSKDAWLKAIKKDGLPWTQVSDLKGWDNEVCKIYSVESVPKNFLIDPDGKIVATDLRGAQLNEKLSRILLGKN